MIEHLIFYIHYIYINGINKKEYTNMPQQLKMYMLFHEQVCERDTKMEKSLLDEENKKAT